LKAGEQQVVEVWTDDQAPAPKAVRVYGWNAPAMTVNVK